MPETHEVVDFGEPFYSKPLHSSLTPVLVSNISLTQFGFQTHLANLERDQSIVQRITPSISWTFSRRGYDDRDFLISEAERLNKPFSQHRFMSYRCPNTTQISQRPRSVSRTMWSPRLHFGRTIPDLTSHRPPLGSQPSKKKMERSRCSNVSRGSPSRRNAIA